MTLGCFNICGEDSVVSGSPMRAMKWLECRRAWSRDQDNRPDANILDDHEGQITTLVGISNKTDAMLLK